MILSPVARYLVRFVALAYVLVLVVVPVGLIAWRTFAPGPGAFFASISTPAAVSALQLSLLGRLRPRRMRRGRRRQRCHGRRRADRVPDQLRSDHLLDATRCSDASNGARCARRGGGTVWRKGKVWRALP